MARRSTKDLSRRWLPGLALVGCAAAGLGVSVSGCSAQGDCVSNEAYFQEQVWTAFMSENCFSCHREGGQASHTEFILRGSEWPGYIEQNLAVLEELSRVEVEETAERRGVCLAPPATCTSGFSYRPM